jgi:hypothetical protein
VGDTGKRRQDWIALLLDLPVQPEGLDWIRIQVLSYARTLGNSKLSSAIRLSISELGSAVLPSILVFVPILHPIGTKFPKKRIKQHG